ncbi:hypothetical protein V1505DRAFT_63021 [Lipomyces doorenjongii]
MRCINGIASSERWAEISTRRRVNFGNSTTPRVEGSHAALKVALTSSSGTLLTTGNKINRRSTDQSEYRSIVGSNENLDVRLEIRSQVETANLCTAISRQALELVYAEVNKLHHSAEDGTKDDCSCAAWNRDLLPCRHRIQFGTVAPQHRLVNNIDPDTLSSALKDPSIKVAPEGHEGCRLQLRTY